MPAISREKLYGMAIRMIVIAVVGCGLIILTRHDDRRGWIFIGIGAVLAAVHVILGPKH
jgi:hypothetical protein